MKRATLDAIVRGDIERVYRRWKKPSVKAGTRLNTAVGIIEVVAIEATPMAAIRATDAHRAGYPTRAALIEQLAAREGTTYCIDVRHGGADPRVALREKRLTVAERRDVKEALARLPWAVATLELIRDNPGVRAEDLAKQVGLTKKQLKPRVRRLKALGLTISLETGYRLSPRGLSFLGEA